MEKQLFIWMDLRDGKNTIPWEGESYDTGQTNAAFISVWGCVIWAALSETCAFKDVWTGSHWSLCNFQITSGCFVSQASLKRH